MSMFLNIATTAAILYIVSLGLLIILGVQKLINFAHGAFLTIGGYVAVVVAGWHIPPWTMFPTALVFGAVVGAASERLIVRPLYGRSLDAILATWGLSIVIIQLVTVIFGRGVASTPSLGVGLVHVYGVPYSGYRLTLLAGAFLIGSLMWLSMHGTEFGLRARAVIMNEELARVLGINSDFIRLATFCTGAALASLAGTLLSPLVSVDPLMGVSWLLDAFMLVLVAGSSLLSLALACIVFGGAQVIVSFYGNPIIGSLTIVVLAAVVLRIRPSGFAIA